MGIENIGTLYQKHENGTVDLTESFFSVPEIVKVDTESGNKETYQSIAETFEIIGKGVTNENAVAFLATTADTLDEMSMQIYEHYRKLQDVFKQVLRHILLEYSDDFSKLKEPEKLAYAILKACRMGLLLKEKYLQVGIDLAESLQQDDSEMMKKVCEEKAVWKSN